LKTAVRQLRKNSTEVEKKLWFHIRNRQILDCKFRRQHSIGNFVVDFCCVEVKLVIELDGGQHSEFIEKDRLRTIELNKKGFKVLRFWNHEVVENLGGVLQKIFEVLRSPSP